MVAVICKSASLSGNRQSLSNGVQRPSVQSAVCRSAGLQQILCSRHSQGLSRPALWLRSVVDVRREGARGCEFDDNLRGARHYCFWAVIDPTTSTWPAPPPFVGPFPAESEQADHHRCSSVPVPSLCLFRGRWMWILRGGGRARMD